MKISSIQVSDRFQIDNSLNRFALEWFNYAFSDRSQPNGSSVGITSIGAVSHINNVKHLEEGTKSNNKKGKKKDKKQKIRKEDIGNPINFQ